MAASTGNANTQSSPGVPNRAQATTGTPVSLPPNFHTLDPGQLANLIRSFTGTSEVPPASDLNVMFERLINEGNLKGDALDALSNLAQIAFSSTGNNLPPNAQATPIHPFMHMNEPGPSSHPRGPPNLGQLPAGVAQQAMQQMQPPMTQPDGSEQIVNGADDNSDGSQPSNSIPVNSTASGNASTGRSRGNRNPAMGSDEWARQRKDNHKEVERRRRGNINEGINELGRIVPNGSGEKAKGAILSRAVQYIHHLKENEARNIEKWTLEKLLMDQAMGDLQAQLDEMRRMWEEERAAKSRAEAELEALKGSAGGKRKDADTANGDRETKRARAD